MTEFTKTKIHFALAALGTLFVLHSYVRDYNEQAAFEYLGYRLTPLLAFGLVAALVAFSVYCYAWRLVSEKPHSWPERIGNYSYALALMVPPLYAAVYATEEVAKRVDRPELAWAARAVPVVPAVLTGLWLLLAWLLRGRLGAQEQSAKIDQLANQEISSLNRARELFAQEHYDLSVVEAWRAIEARLRRVLLKNGLGGTQDDPQDMIRKAAKAGLVQEPALKLLQQLRRQWNVAVSTEPLTREAAHAALQAARDILSTIAVEPAKRGERAL